LLLLLPLLPLPGRPHWAAHMGCHGGQDPWESWGRIGLQQQGSEGRAQRGGYQGGEYIQRLVKLRCGCVVQPSAWGWQMQSTTCLRRGTVMK
jgi:hypothetical protein